MSSKPCAWESGENKIEPNPSKGNIKLYFIQSINVARVTVHNLLGKHVFQNKRISVTKNI